MNKNLVKIRSNISSYKKSYILCLLIVCSFGIYKNIINLFNTDQNTLYLLSKIFFLIIGFCLGMIFDSIKEKKLQIGLNGIMGLILAMIVPFKTNILFFIICLIIMGLIDFIDKNNNINKICLTKIIVMIFLMICGNYTYLNPLELNNEYAYTLLDNFIGNQVGAIFSSSVLLILISLIILSLNKIYKSKIAILSIMAYLGSLLILLLNKDYMNTFKLMQNSMNIFTFVFITPFSIYTPYKNRDIIIYSLIAGIGGALISYYFLQYEGAIISTLIANIITIILSRIHKTTKNA